MSVFVLPLCVVCWSVLVVGVVDCREIFGSLHSIWRYRTVGIQFLSRRRSARCCMQRNTYLPYVERRTHSLPLNPQSSHTLVSCRLSRQSDWQSDTDTAHRNENNVSMEVGKTIDDGW